MIIARAPLRLCLGGGGTDLPSYFESHGPGCTYFASLNWGVTVIRTAPVIRGHYTVQTDKTAHYATRAEIEHPLVRAACAEWVADPARFIIVSDAPMSSGLGASGAITAALVATLVPNMPDHTLAMEAAHLEMDVLCKTVGYQDPMAAVYGGIHRIDMSAQGDGGHNVKVTRVGQAEWSDTLSTHSLLIRCPKSDAPRDAGSVLAVQDKKSRRNDLQTVASLRASIDYGRRFIYALQEHKVKAMAQIMRHYWERKKTLSSGIAPRNVQILTNALDELGCPGYKLVGAGGSGFVWALFPTPAEVREAAISLGRQFKVYYPRIGEHIGLSISGHELPELV